MHSYVRTAGPKGNRGTESGTGKQPRCSFARQKRRAGIQISLKVLCKKKIAESAKIRKIDEIGEIQPYFAKSVKIAKLLKLQLKL